MAEFLTDGDPYGGLKKSMKELQENDQKAVELCRSLATHYSKQLYEIYKNKRILFSLARATTDSFLICKLWKDVNYLSRTLAIFFFLGCVLCLVLEYVYVVSRSDFT